jgi:class 3 adenylate cyclase
MRSKKERAEFVQYVTDYTTAAVANDAYKGMLVFLAFMIYDFYASPTNYLRVWSIRISVALICFLLLFFQNKPMIKANRRFVFLLGMLLIMNSTPIIVALTHQEALPSDNSLCVAALILFMTLYRILLVDALVLGAIYCGSFVLLLIYRDAPDVIWRSYLIGLGTAYIFGALVAYVSDRDLYRSFVTDKLLRQETNRADNLLVKTFPIEVAKELKDHQRSPARRIDNVTVLFCDIVSFTSTASELQPEEVVDWLNQVFSKFDQLAEEHGCEKIKTIGDAYMVVCGAPTPCSDHALRIVKLAMAFHDAAKQLYLNGAPLTLRIGINTGSIVAGVIGQKRFAYDLWGDSVNLASRMESLAKPGKTLLTDHTKAHLGNTFQLEKITGLNVKGKGQMDAWEFIKYNAHHEIKKRDVAS